MTRPGWRHPGRHRSRRSDGAVHHGAVGLGHPLQVPARVARLLTRLAALGLRLAGVLVAATWAARWASCTGFTTGPPAGLPAGTNTVFVKVPPQ